MTENDMDISSEQKIMRKLRRLSFLTTFLLLLSIVSTLLIIKINSFYTADHNKQIIREFIEQTIETINQNEDYYKNRCSDDAVAEIKLNRSAISRNYKIIFLDVDAPIYEYNVIFDGNNVFKVDVWFEKYRMPKIVHFSYDRN